MGNEKDQEKESDVVMDTPERTQIATPLSKFENSPVFNYINSLSPIKPVKSVHFTQTFASLNFASPPSVFTSPHLNSLKDSKFFKRQQFSSDQSKPELHSENAKKAETIDGNLNTVQNPLKQNINFNSSNSITEISVNHESTKPSYESVSPDTLKMVNDGSANSQPRTETEFEEINAINHAKLSGCDWDSLISDASELLNFDTVPYNGPDQSVLDCTSFKAEGTDANALEKYEGLNRADEIHDLTVASTSLNNFEGGDLAEDIDNEDGSNLCRGMRRRCLLFETAGSRRKLLEESKQTVLPLTDEYESSRSILPGIGLHLNTISSNLIDQKTVKHESSGSGTQLIIEPRSSVYGSMGSGQESTTNEELSQSQTSPRKKTGPTQNGVPVSEDASKARGFVINEELSQSQSQTSPRKKRRRVENGGETEACKRCNCKKSRCLKLYCECFAAGVYCVEPCSCQECFNKPIHEETVLATRKQIESRNPIAFAPKVIKSSDSMQEDESNNTPASARHKRGCNCKKSGCLKKYCECYQGGVGCSINCRCEACKNTFGRQDGSERDIQVNVCDGSLQMVLHNEAEPVSANPVTPSRFGRQSIPSLNSSKSKPPRSFLAIGSSSIQNFSNPNPFKGVRNNQLHTVDENAIPDILEQNRSPIRGVKSCSPNSKRVSPPHSTTARSSRKLILQSIPSFPCLTPNPK